jgi:hypothetical protein
MSTTTQTKNTLAKNESTALGENVYLLGADADGIRYWLSAPKWDCDWYWGFGYVSTYTKNSEPSRAKDSDSHTHIDSSFIGKHEYYDSESSSWKTSDYIHNIYNSPKFATTTFDEQTGWILSELFNEFYILKRTAELYHTGGAHTTTSPIQNLLKNPEQYNHINKVLIPAITAKIIELLTPIK